MHVRYTSVENIERKGEIAFDKQFLLFSQCFLPYMALIFHFNPFPNKPWFFTCRKHKSFENTVGKEETAQNKQFVLFPRCFLPVWRAFCHFHQIWNCHLQTLSVWKSLKFVVWERVKCTLECLQFV